MKKNSMFICLTVVCAAALWCVSCAKETQSYKHTELNAASSAHAVSIDKALGELESVLSVLDSGTTRAQGRTIGNIKAVRCGDIMPATRIPRDSIISTADTLLFVVNFANNGGYAILGADDRLDVVLAVTDSGQFTLDFLQADSTTHCCVIPEEDEQVDTIEVESLSSPMTRVIIADESQTEHEIESFTRNILVHYCCDAIIFDGETTTEQTDGMTTGGGTGATEPSGSTGAVPAIVSPNGSTTTDWTLDSYVYPLIKTKWGQGSPFNDLCPIKSGSKKTNGRAPAGCGAIATAQIMNYYKHPTTHYVDNSEHNYDFVSIDSLYNSLYFSINNTDYAGCAYSTHQVAQFVYDIGKECNIVYGSAGSSTNCNKIKKAYEIMGYSNVHKYNSYDDAVIHAALNRFFPVIIRARTQWIGGEGHIWIIDGCAKRYKYENDSRIDQTLLHCNFGWAGRSDGYYLSKMFDTTVMPQYVEQGFDNNKSPNITEDDLSYHYRLLICERP